jgi:hypothetical protein
LKARYKIKNISGYDISFFEKMDSSNYKEDIFYDGEIVYGIEEDAVKLLINYQKQGLVEISEMDNIDWRKEGF